MIDEGASAPFAFKGRFMIEEKKIIKKPVKERHVALKTLCIKEGVRVKRGDEFTCTTKEAEFLRSVKAI